MAAAAFLKMSCPMTSRRSSGRYDGFFGAAALRAGALRFAEDFFAADFFAGAFFFAAFLAMTVFPLGSLRGVFVHGRGGWSSFENRERKRWPGGRPPECSRAR